MHDLSRRFPDDLDARALYALSLLGLTPLRNHANYMLAAAEAEAVYDIDKHHPGALHYMIHAYDDPVHAPLGLRAARLYAQVAPAAPHAVHMTSHIFFALGLWDDAIQANDTSLRVARAQGNRNYHSLLWLEYAYLQKDQQEPAAALVRSVASDVAAQPSKDNRLRLALARAIWTVETHGADGVGAELADDGTGIETIGYFSVHDYARGITAAKSGDLPAARAALRLLRLRYEAAKPRLPGENADWYDAMTPNEVSQSRILANALAGVIEFYRGRHAAGLAQVRKAVAAASHFEFEFGPPWAAKPLEELLGELLLRDGQRNEAIAAFQTVLAVYPNRRLRGGRTHRRPGATVRCTAVSALRRWLHVSLLLGAALTIAAADARGTRTRREDLIGAWRLARIEVAGPQGSGADPFYGTGSEGLLIYDAAGWFSVQIMGSHRPALDVPARRPSPADDTRRELEAAALDSYYAYYGTWSFNAETSTVTHQAKGALYPAEHDATYPQHVEVDGSRMTFTRTQMLNGERSTQRKLWIRVSPP